MSLVFYDTETTGTETFFDQILQFAAVKTDEDLNEIDRFQIRCRLLPHIVPAPEAISITGLTVFQLTDLALPSHYEMVRAIRAKLLSWSPALFVGWNSIRFDEDLIRQALYKTLHGPYLTNTNGNTRSDIMRIVQACSLHAPAALVFPIGENGEKTFALGRVAPANGFAHESAHEAMGDVEATLFICRLLVEKAPQLWSSFMRFSKKASVIDYINDERVYCLSDFYYSRPYSYMVTTLGQNQANTAEWYVYDLNIDPQSLRSLDDGQLLTRLGEWPKPVRRLKSNAAPMIFPADEAPENCRSKVHGMDELERRATVLQEDRTFCDRIISVFESARKEYPPSTHVEQQIYDGFIGKGDEKLMEEFHAAAWHRRPGIVERFQDSRLRAIGKQLIHIERPEVLDETSCKQCDLEVAKRLLGHGENVCWLTLPQALQQLEVMIKDGQAIPLQLLREHEQHLRIRHQLALKHII